MVLLLVLLVVALLVTVLTELSFSTLVDTRLAETFRDSTRAGYLARGGVKVGQLILQDDSNGYDATDELWAIGVQQYPVADGAVTIEIVDQDGRVALNQLYNKATNAADAVIKPRYLRLLEQLGAERPEALVDALVDWLDPDDVPEAAGAESSTYLARSEPYRCKNGPLDSLDELLLVEGYTPELLTKLRPHVTAYGRAGGGDYKVNINTASREVLIAQSEDVDESVAETLLAERAEKPFASVSEINSRTGLSLYTGNLDVVSKDYRITATATVNDGRATLDAFVKKLGGTTTILFQRML